MIEAKRESPNPNLSTRLSVLEERLRNSDANLVAAAIEVERRMMELDHAHAEARNVLQTYTPREVYDSGQKEFLIWQRKIDDVMSKSRGQTSISSIIAIVIAVTSILVSLVPHFVTK